MKPLLSLVLIALFAATPVPLAAQGAGPLVQAMTRHVAELASRPAPLGPPAAGRQTSSEWSRVRGLKPDAAVVVTVQGAQPAIRRVVAVDNVSLTVRDDDGPAGGIETLARGDIQEIRRVGNARRSTAAAIATAAGGFVLGGVLAINLAHRQCGSSCADERALIAASLVGLPVAAGVAGYYAAGGRNGEVIYRAPGTRR